MVAFIDTIREHPVTTTGILTARKVYGWISENLWPVYSTGIVISVVCMLGAAQEKQILADHLYGQNKHFSENTTEVVDAASKQMDEEVAVGIKQDVFSLPKLKFVNEYESRQ